MKAPAVSAGRWPAWSALLLAGLTLLGAPARADSIESARFAEPVVRYGHFALGRPHEYARLTVTTHSGREVSLQLPEDEVFEDRVPRLVKLSASEPTEILAIVSQRHSGARLALFRLVADRLELSASSPAIQTPMRWLNPVAVADLDGDGQAEIAAVITPHIGGTLKVYQKQGQELREIAALAGFSNHVLGSTELGLAAPVARAGRSWLLVPDSSRRWLRAIVLEGGRLTDKGRCPLPEPATGALEITSDGAVSIGLASGQRHRVAGDCLR